MSWVDYVKSHSAEAEALLSQRDTKRKRDMR